MTYEQFSIVFDRFRAESRARQKSWEDKFGRRDPRIAREKLAKIMAELEARLKK